MLFKNLGCFDDVYFAHISKCAGTSIVKSLSSISTSIPTKTTIKSDFIEDTLDIHRLPEDENFLPSRCDFKFIAVRNPYDRLVSEFSYEFMYLTNIPYMLKYGMPNLFNGLPIKNDIDGFRKFVQLYEHDNYQLVYDEHIISMKSYFNKIKYDIVIRYESLNLDFNKLCNMLNIGNVVLPHVNISNHQSYQAYYDTVTRDKVFRLFEEDFDYFKYSKEVS